MVSFDKEACKEIFDILAANGAGKASDSDTLQKLQDVGYDKLVIKNQGILNHIERLKSSDSVEQKPQKKHKEHKAKEKEDNRDNTERMGFHYEKPFKENAVETSIEMPEVFMSM